MDGFPRSKTRNIQAKKTQLAATLLLYLWVKHDAYRLAEVWSLPSLGRRLQCSRPGAATFPVHSLSACCGTSLNMLSVQQGRVQEHTIVRQDYSCLSAQNSRAAFLRWLKAFTITIATLKMLHVHLAWNVKVRPCRLCFWDRHSLSLIFWERHSFSSIFWIPATGSQGRTDLQSLVNAWNIETSCQIHCAVMQGCVRRRNALTCPEMHLGGWIYSHCLKKCTIWMLLRNDCSDCCWRLGLTKGWQSGQSATTAGSVHIELTLQWLYLYQQIL